MMRNGTRRLKDYLLIICIVFRDTFIVINVYLLIIIGSSYMILIIRTLEVNLC